MTITSTPAVHGLKVQPSAGEVRLTPAGGRQIVLGLDAAHALVDDLRSAIRAATLAAFDADVCNLEVADIEPALPGAVTYAIEVQYAEEDRWRTALVSPHRLVAIELLKSLEATPGDDRRYRLVRRAATR